MIMARINVRLNDVESGFTVYPEGPMLVEIQEKSRVAKSKGSGELKIIWISKIMDGEFEGKPFSWDTSLQKQALWVLKGMLEVIGLEWDEDGFELDDCIYQQLIVDVIVGDFEGNPRNYVQGYHKA